MELPGGIHERIGNLRTAAGISQKDLSKALGVQPSILSRIERGETKAISHELVIKIADYFHVSTDFLLGVSEQVSTMKQQAIEEKQDKPDFSEMDMVQMISGMMSGADLDEYEMALFQQLVLHILQRKSQDAISSNEE